MNFRVNDLKTNSWANAVIVLFQGCLRKCSECPTKSIQPMYGGNRMDTEEIEKLLTNDPSITKALFTGGEPFLQPLAALDLARFAHAKGKTVWCQTHYSFEQILQWEDSRKALLKEIDILVDEPYTTGEDENRVHTNDCGDREQRTIDVKKSLEKGEVVLCQMGIWTA